MPKPAGKQLKTEDALAQISRLGRSVDSDAARDLPPFLRHKSNHVVTAAANLAKRLEREDLGPDLAAAFEALFPKAPANDQGCKALTAITEALVSLGYAAPEVYEKGVRHIQKEGSFGPPVDVASTLRGVCARGMVRMRHPEALYEAVRLLVDPEVPARVGAVRALGDSGSREAELLLRFKVLTGDKEEEVIAECFTGLMAVAPARSIPFVASYLEAASEDRIESAALALGESRQSIALPFLKDACTHSVGRLRRIVLLAIGLLRNDEAIRFLLDRLSEDGVAGAQDILEALSLYRNDGVVRSQVLEITAQRKIPCNWGA